MNSAHVCLVEVVPEGGCELDPAEFEGASLRCYVAAETPDQARELVLHKLTADRFRVVKVEWCANGRTSHWESPSDEDAEALMREAEELGDVVYGRCDAWGNSVERPGT
jgi:hypothetical protein